MNNKTNTILQKICFTLMFIFTFIYIFWRLFFTIPVELGFIPIFFALMLVFIEFWDFFDFFVYYINILMSKKTIYKKPKVSKNTTLPDVDIFIATYDESEKVLKKTIEGCLNLEYDDKSKLHIYICDDGNRENIKQLAALYNISYITRDNRIDAKAGNYNNALSKTFSPYIATFDADMVPNADFLVSAIPYFLNDNYVGFVQYPQDFYNPDIFQYRLNLEDSIPYEQSHFYYELQMYKNTINSPIYCGTNAVLSRQALDNISGFATGTVSEDIATGMLIESKGYKGIAINSQKATGESVLDLQGFLKQRSRWAKGCIQMAKKYKIMHLKGLNFRQKLEYLSCVSYWFLGLKKLVYLIAPTLFTIWGISIITCKFSTFLLLWVPMYVLKRFILDLIFKHKRSSTWTNIYETILAPDLFIAVIKQLFTKKDIEFDVTPKMNNNTNSSKYASLKLLAKHLILLIINIIGIICAVFKVTTLNYTYYILSFVWISINIFYLLIAIKFDINNRTSNYQVIKEQKIQYKTSTLINIFFKRKKEIN